MWIGEDLRDEGRRKGRLSTGRIGMGIKKAFRWKEQACSQRVWVNRTLEREGRIRLEMQLGPWA